MKHSCGRRLVGGGLGRVIVVLGLVAPWTAISNLAADALTPKRCARQGGKMTQKYIRCHANTDKAAKKKKARCARRFERGYAKVVAKDGCSNVLPLSSRLLEGMNECLQGDVSVTAAEEADECQAQALVWMTTSQVKGPPSSQSPTGAPTSERERCIADTLSSQLYFTADMEARLRDPSSHQNRALQWLAVEDPQEVDCTDALNLKFRYALATFYFATGGPQWKQSWNWLSDAHICRWWDNKNNNGVGGSEMPMGLFCRVDEEAGTVDAFLQLTDNNLVGTIPEEIVLVQELFSVSLSVNRLNGTLPERLVPELPKLFELLLDHNFFDGTIPASYGDSSTLTVLYLHNNALVGTVPASLADNDALAWLNLGFNRLRGGIPRTFRHHSHLVRLLLSSNRLGGDLSETVDEALPRGLQYLWLGSNRFNGTIPSLLGDQFADMRSLDLRNNLRLAPGVLPASFQNWTRLWQLTLNACQLTGTLPFGNSSPEEASSSFPELEWIQLVDNQLTGTIPTALFSWSRLHKLLVSKNQLTGTIPTEVGRLSLLSELALGTNRFTGPLPTELGLLTPLDSLGTSENQFTGTLLTEMGQLQQLRLVSMRDNQFHGPLPREWGKLRRLRNLILDGNQLDGKVPKSFTNLKRLEYLDLSENDIVGNISFVCEAIPTIDNFAADCFGADSNVICNCCNICCDASGRCFAN